MCEAPEKPNHLTVQPGLFGELRELVQAARQRVARAVNSELVLLYWAIGRRIRQDVLASQRAAYGDEIVSTLSRQLSAEFGGGFSRQNLFHMMRFAETWADSEAVRALAGRLTWSHFKEILYLDDALQRTFYSGDVPRRGLVGAGAASPMRGMLYQRTLLSRQPDAIICQELEQLQKTDQLTPDLVFRDPYSLQ